MLQLPHLIVYFYIKLRLIKLNETHLQPIFTFHLNSI